MPNLFPPWGHGRLKSEATKLDMNSFRLLFQFDKQIIVIGAIMRDEMNLGNWDEGKR